MSNPTLGQSVIYVNSKGNRKAALVTATPQDTSEGTSLQVAEGTVNVVIFNPLRGNTSARSNVPVGKEAFDAAVAAAENFEPEVTTDEDGYEEYTEGPSAPTGFIEA